MELRPALLALRRFAGVSLLTAALFAAAPARAGETLAPEAVPQMELRTPVEAAAPLHALGPVETVVVSQPEIAKVAAAGPRELYVQGRELGATNLLVFGGDGRLTQTVTVRVGHDADGLREALAAALPDENVEVTALSAGLMMSGELSGPAAVQIAERLAERVAPGAVISRLRARASQVRLDVRIVEASSRQLRDLGVAVSATDAAHLRAALGGGAIGPEAPQTTATARFNAGRYAVDAALQALEAKGAARVVAKPSLVAVSGSKASFHAGGELPYPVPQEDGQVTVEFRRYGAALTFTPEVQANGLIRVALDAELSAVDRNTGLRLAGVEIPALSARRAATAVELREGQPFVIAGLFEETSKDAAQETPGLAKVPLLGAVLRSTRTEEARRELAIIVTPSLALPEPPEPVSPVAGAHPPLETSQTDAPRPEPSAGAQPRGPPLVALVKTVRDVVRPPLRWMKRQVAAIAATLVGTRPTEYASARRR